METARDEQIGGYRILRLLGRGAMGVVYEGEADGGDRVAVKTVGGAMANTLASIRREIMAISRLRHPGIARIVDHGVQGGLPWYAMELLEGRTLRDLISARFDPDYTDAEAASRNESGGRSREWDSAPPLIRVMDVIRRMCAPLAFLHSQGIIHRDLKPENVFVHDDGRIVLVDFGISVRFGDRECELGDHVAELAGTPEYMSPEQILGKNSDARSDLYAVGCILYECLTGRTPFGRASSAAVVSRHLSALPVPPSGLVTGVTQDLDRLVLRLLEKRAIDRLGYADDLANRLALLSSTGEPSSAPASSTRAYLYRPDFVGREETMRRLDATVVGGAAPPRRVVLVGESGIGKTRVLSELAAKATLQGHALVAAQCGVTATIGQADQPDAVPLGAFRNFLKHIADMCQESGDSTTERLLGGRAGILSIYEPELLNVPGFNCEAEAPVLPPHNARVLVATCLRETLLAFAAGRPLLVVVDDLQWADELTLAFLETLSDTDLETREVRVVGACRKEGFPEALPKLVTAAGYDQLVLEGIDQASVSQMVCGMLGLQAPPEAFSAFLYQQSSGNPFFVAEYLRAAIDAEILARDRDGQWQLEADGLDVRAARASVPPVPFGELMAQRVARLDPLALALVQSAAVLGREFSGDLLHTTAEGDDPTILETLRRRHILEEGNEGRLRFAHDRLREIAYAAIPVPLRPELHRRAAIALEGAHGQNSERNDVFPALAHHWALAGRAERAAKYYARAGDHSRRAYANNDALQQYDCAIKALRPLVSDGGGRSEDFRIAIRLIEERRAEVLTLTGRLPEARYALRESLAGLNPSHAVWRSRLVWKQAKTLETEHRHREALALYDDAEASLGPAPEMPARLPPDEASSAWLPTPPSESPTTWWRAWVHLQVERVWVHYWLADVDAMGACVSRVQGIVERQATPPLKARFYQALTHHNLRRDRYRVAAETLRLAEASMAAARETGSPAVISYAEFVLAFQLLFSGRIEASGGVMRDALAGARRTGDLALQARCLTYLTVGYRLLGNLPAALEHAQRSLELATRLRMDDYSGAAHANLAWAAWKANDSRRAEREVGTALELFRGLAPTYPYPFQWLVRLPATEMALRSGAADRAIEHARAVLDPVQHKLPDEVLEPLQLAVMAWTLEKPTGAERRLTEALKAASLLGYL